MKKEINLSLDNENQKKKIFAQIFSPIAKMYNKNIDSEQLKFIFNLAKNDIQKGFFTWDEFLNGISMAVRNNPYFPNYNYIYQEIMNRKKKIEEIKFREYQEKKWKEFNRINIKHDIVKDDLLFTIGQKYITWEEMANAKRAKTDYVMNQIKKRFFDLVYLASIKEIELIKDLREEEIKKIASEQERITHEQRLKELKDEMMYKIFSKKKEKLNG